ncbi:MAG: LacI family DNA-binding transcriptional regulator [Opitutaceae bacterium]|nr:LacI family DNA-binding transcriptional regulator [Opitutaceae bacterium]
MPLKFQSIATQVAQAIHAEITGGTWNRALPGERQLAERFQVSRKTVRKALAALRSVGVLDTRRSRGSSIKTRRHHHGLASQRIALLLPESLEGSRPFTALWVNRLMTLLQASGDPLQIFHGARYFGAHAARSLARLTAAHPARCWILARSNRPLQEWFAASGIPTLISGSAHPGVPLPSVDVDHRALCRHSAALFLRQGHRRLALFLEHGGHGGDIESEQGFREGLAAVPGAPEPVVCTPKRSADSIIREVRRLLARREPPTGLLLSNSYSYLTVLSYLGSLGLRVPRDISIVSRDEETFLRFMYPTPAYYSTPPAKFAQALHQALKRILAGDRSAFAIRIMPNLVKGDSVGPAG